MELNKATKPKWPEVIYYKKISGHIRKVGGRKTIAKINKNLNARQVEFALSQEHNQIYRYNNDKTIEAYLKGGFWEHMIAFDRIDATPK